MRANRLIQGAGSGFTPLKKSTAESIQPSDRHPEVGKFRRLHRVDPVSPGSSTGASLAGSTGKFASNLNCKAGWHATRGK